MSQVIGSDLEVGVARLDEEHVELMRELDALGNSSSRTLEEMRAALSFLSHHVSEHFLEEERYMIAAGYPGLEAHKLEHERLAVFASDAQDLLERDPNEDELSRTIRSLAGQLTRHMHHADRQLAHYLRDGAQA